MPLFFFHFRDRGYLHEDRKGIDLPDLHAALEEVLRTTRELAGEPIEGDGLEFEIADSSGCVVLKVPIRKRWCNLDPHSCSGTRNMEWHSSLRSSSKYLHYLFAFII